MYITKICCSFSNITIKVSIIHCFGNKVICTTVYNYELAYNNSFFTCLLFSRTHWLINLDIFVSRRSFRFTVF